ncbi:MAG: DMT family transporter [Nitriliruptor sp.]|nr:MAG: DMT family transporter [Nitriliruptor sp.]
MVVRPWLGAVLISFSGVWVRLADVEVARSAFLRVAYALPLLAVLVVVRAGTGDDERRWFRPVAFAAGLLFGVNLVAWHASIQIIGAGLGTVLPNLQVVVVGLLGVVLFRERPRAGFWVALPVVLVGIWLLSALGQPVIADGSVPVGVGFGVLAGVTYGTWLVVLRLARGRDGGGSAPEMLWSLTLGGFVVTGAVALWEGVAGPAGWPADGWLLVLAVGSQVVGWLLLTSSIHLLPAAATSVALLLQPVLALVWGAVLLSEPVRAPQVAGAAIVLLGVALAHRAVREVRVAPILAERSAP